MYLEKAFSNEAIPALNQTLCAYTNGTRELVVIRIKYSDHCCLERVIFPLQRFLFEAPPDAWLEVYRNTSTGVILGDRIACHQLRIWQESEVEVEVQAQFLFNQPSIRELEFQPWSESLLVP